MNYSDYMGSGGSGGGGETAASSASSSIGPISFGSSNSNTMLVAIVAGFGVLVAFLILKH